MYQIESGKKNAAVKITIYGPEGVGKTTLASKFPNPLFIDTEGSTTHMDVNRLQRPQTFTELKQMIQWVKQTKPCSTLVIDTADWAEALTEKHIIAENNLKSIEDIGYGGGYVMARELWGKYLDELTGVIEAGINVVNVAHSKIIKFEDPTSLASYDRYELKLSERKNANNSALLKEWSDAVLFLNYEVYAQKEDKNSTTYKAQGGQRKIYATHRPAFDAKNRFELPDEMPLGYDQIAHIVPDLISQHNQQVVDEIVTTTSTPQPVQDAPVENVQPEAPFEPSNISNEQLNNNMEVINQSLEGVRPEYLPIELWNLMETNQVTEDEVRAVMGSRGHYPINTDFKVIASTQPEYFTGGLASNWEGVLSELNRVRADKSILVDLYRKVGDATPEQTVNNLNIKWN